IGRSRATVHVEVIERRPGHHPRPDLQRTLTIGPLDTAHDQDRLVAAELPLDAADVSPRIGSGPAEGTLRTPTPAILRPGLEGDAILDRKARIRRLASARGVLGQAHAGADRKVLPRLCQRGGTQHHRQEQSEDHPAHVYSSYRTPASREAPACERSGYGLVT